MRSIVLLFFAVAAIAQAPSFKPKPVGNLKQVMRSIPYPNSDIIFAVQGKAPKDEKEWQTVENAAIAISETAARHSANSSCSMEGGIGGPHYPE